MEEARRALEDRSSGSVLVPSKEAEIILAAPSALNPIPALPAALRVDNQEQLLTLLTDERRQLLVFGTEGLRTLLLRQVLSDPHTRTFRKKKNWDAQGSFPLPKELNVVQTKLLLENEADNSTVVDIVTYFLRPATLAHTQLVAQRIQKHKKRNIQHRIVYLPQPTALVHKMLHNLGLISMPNVSIHHLQLDLFPLETDIISLEYDNATREADVEGTPSPLITTVARSLLKLQDVVGRIPRIQAYGTMAEEVLRKLMNLTVDEYLVGSSSNDCVVHQGGGDSVVPVSDAAALVILDRKVDWVTPMLTPLTYEGLLDEVFGIECGFITVDVDTINPEDDEEKKIDDDRIVALGLNGSDSLYAEVRDQHVEKFGSFLQNQAKALQESHANFTSKGKKKDLSEIHQFVKQIPIFTQNLRSLTNHIHLAEKVKKTSEEVTFREQWQLERSILEGETAYDQLEELVASQYPPFRFFRLLCLQSLCAGGIKSSRYDAFRRDVVQTYGYEYLFVLKNLERAGLLSRREGLWIDTASPFNSLRKSLILINAEVDTVDPDDISYVSSGFAPMSVRLLQTAVKGWTGRDDILRELPGRLLDITQQNPPEDLAAALKRRPTSTLGKWAEENPAAGSKKPVLVVMYVGGVTYMELAALRFLSKRQSFPYHIICCTTMIINGETLLRSLS